MQSSGTARSSGSYLDLEPGLDRPKISSNLTTHFSTALQPWKTFFVVRWPENTQEAKERLKRNLLHFQANYLAMTGLMLVVLQLDNLLGLCATVLVALLWTVAPQVGSETLSPAKVGLLAALSLMVLYLAAGTLLLNMAFIGILCSGLHAVLHPGSVEVGNFELIDEAPDLAHDLIVTFPALMRPDVDFPESDSLLENAARARGSEIDRHQEEPESVVEAEFMDPAVQIEREDPFDHLPRSLDEDQEEPLQLPLCGPEGLASMRPSAEPSACSTSARTSPICALRCGCEGIHSEGDALQTAEAAEVQVEPREEVPESGLLSNTVEPHTPRQLAAWKKAGAQQAELEKAKLREFQIDIAKKGQKLGIRYDDSDGTGLVIKIINPGVFYDSIMEQNSDRWVMPDDRIVEVNGVRGKSEWLEEQCMKADVLSMKVERLLPPLGVRIFCRSQDPTVKIHAYDLFGHGRGPLACVARTLNGMSTRYGLFHTGVEVYGCEWFFGASAEGLFHGVNCNEAKQHAQHRYRTSVVLGATAMSQDDFEELMPLLRMKWPAWSYHPISRNCHSFTDFFCKILGFRSVPRFGLFGSGDSSVVPGPDRTEARSLMPGCGCSSLKAGEGRGAVSDPSKWPC